MRTFLHNIKDGYKIKWIANNCFSQTLKLLIRIKIYPCPWLTGSASARRREGDGLILSLNCVTVKDVKSFTYRCYVRCTTFIVWEGGRQRSCNHRVGCLQLLGSRAFGPPKLSGPCLLSTIPCGMTRMIKVSLRIPLR